MLTTAQLMVGKKKNRSGQSFFVADFIKSVTGPDKVIQKWNGIETWSSIIWVFRNVRPQIAD